MTLGRMIRNYLLRAKNLKRRKEVDISGRSARRALSSASSWFEPGIEQHRPGALEILDVACHNRQAML